MPLPENGSAWPLPRNARELAQMAEWSAWYSGDPIQLADHYSAPHRARARVRPSQESNGIVGSLARWWWGTPTPVGEKDAKLHVGLAADICGTSADLLFSAPVKLSGGQSDTLTKALEGLQDNGLDAQLHEAAELTAALGGGYLRVMWDRSISPLPWTDAVHADMASPEFRMGRLSAVTFWQVLPSTDDRTVWRLLERHEPGFILHGLYQGTTDKLGQQHPLEAHPDSAYLAKVVDANGAQPTGTQLLTATYVPNMLPNRLLRGSQQGRSDLQGVTPFLDALDEAYSSWWRDIRLAKTRVYMAASMLESAGPGQGAIAQTDRELIVPVQTLARDTNGLALQVEQFDIRVEEHKATCEAWTKTIVESAGYSSQSLSGDTGGAITAAEVHSHERRSYMTRGKKVRYWTLALRQHLAALVEVANANLSAAIAPGDLSVEFADGVQDSALSVAQTAQALFTAEAASIQTRVQMVHPDWDDAAIQDEVSRIQDESPTSGGTLFDPTGL